MSSWAARQRPLLDWLVDELTKRYYVPRKLAQEWANAEKVLPLLDGLDEVAPEHREACVEAINAFRREHSMVAFAVCSRASEYEELRVRLELSGAVIIRLLSREQIGNYLKQAGKALTGVRTVLQEDETLWELLETPLMLSIVALAYQGGSAAQPRATGSLEERRTHLFANYTRRMFQRRSKVTAYAPEQTEHWLSWLARSLMHSNLSVFYLEWMQPDWLPSRAQRWILVIMSIMVAGVVGSVPMGLLGLLFSGKLLEWVHRGVGSYGLSAEFVFRYVTLLFIVEVKLVAVGLIGGLIAALVGGLLYALGVRLDRIAPVEALRWSWQKVRSSWTRGLAYGMLLGLVFGIIVQLLDMVPKGASLAADAMSSGPLSFLILRLYFGLLVCLGPGLICGLILGLLFGLFGGLVSDRIVTRTSPNEGIRLSVRNALISLLPSGLVFALALFFITAFLDGVLAGLQVGRATGLFSGLQAGLIAVAAKPKPKLYSDLFLLGWLFFGLRNGGFAYIKHYVLRLLLWRNGYAPWNYVRFLDFAAERVFLRKVGGGYIFTHRLLMEYFATLQSTARQTQTA